MVWLSYFPAYLLYCIVTHFILDNKCYQSNTAASQNYHSFHVSIAQNVSGDSGFSWRNWSQNVRNHLLVKLKKVSTVGYPSVWRFAQVTRQFASAHFIFWVGKAARKQKAKQPETICSVSSFGLIVPLSTVCLSLLETDFLTTLAEFMIRVESLILPALHYLPVALEIQFWFSWRHRALHLFFATTANLFRRWKSQQVDDIWQQQTMHEPFFHPHQPTKQTNNNNNNGIHTIWHRQART